MDPAVLLVALEPFPFLLGLKLLDTLLAVEVVSLRDKLGLAFLCFVFVFRFPLVKGCSIPYNAL